MDSTYISDDSYSTTPLKSEGSSSTIARRQVYDRNSSNPYKTPIRCKVNHIIKGNLTKPNAYKNSVIEKMPIYSPPPKNISFVKNPFEHARLLKERLSQPICSPSIFQTVVSPSQASEFSWSIEDISSFRPAQIDENPSQDFDSWFSPATENEAQEAINKFFSSHIVHMESPVLSEIKKNSSSLDDTPIKEKPILIDTWSQTTLSFPSVLPPDVEAILNTYYSFNSNQANQNDDLNTSNSSVSRKKLYFDDLNDDNSNPNSNCTTPQRPKIDSSRRADVSTPITINHSSPELSPIASATSEDSPMDVSLRHKSIIRLNMTNDIEMTEKENVLPNDWSLQGCSTPRASQTQSSDSAFSSL